MHPLSALHSARLRNVQIRRAADRAVDRAMRRLHDGPELPPQAVSIDSRTLEAVPVLGQPSLAPEFFHERMKTDPSGCRWCGEAQREALAELEEDDA